MKKILYIMSILALAPMACASELVLSKEAMDEAKEKKLLAIYEAVEADVPSAIRYADKAILEYNTTEKPTEEQQKLIGRNMGLAISAVSRANELVDFFKEQFDKDKDSIKDSDKRDEIEMNIHAYSKRLKAILGKYKILKGIPLDRDRILVEISNQ